MKVIKSLIILAIGILYANQLSAKDAKFKTEQSAIDAIRIISTKYWDNLIIKDKTDTKVEVSLTGSKLIFVERSTYTRPANIGRESFSEEKKITTEIDLKYATVSNTLTTVMLVAHQPNSIHQVVAWTSKSLDNSNEFLAIYTVPLDYKELSKEVDDLQTIKNAISFLSKRYHPKEPRKKFSMKVGH